VIEAPSLLALIGGAALTFAYESSDDLRARDAAFEAWAARVQLEKEEELLARDAFAAAWKHHRADRARLAEALSLLAQVDALVQLAKGLNAMAAMNADTSVPDEVAGPIRAYWLQRFVDTFRGHGVVLASDLTRRMVVELPSAREDGLRHEVIRLRRSLRRAGQRLNLERTRQAAYLRWAVAEIRAWAELGFARDLPGVLHKIESHYWRDQRIDAED
jgi:hypothetical protein